MRIESFGIDREPGLVASDGCIDQPGSESLDLESVLEGCSTEDELNLARTGKGQVGRMRENIAIGDMLLRSGLGLQRKPLLRIVFSPENGIAQHPPGLIKLGVHLMRLMAASKLSGISVAESVGVLNLFGCGIRLNPEQVVVVGKRF